MHGRKLNRLPGFDYSRDGWYFVTICTKVKGNVLGEIRNKMVFLNELGRVVEYQWLWLTRRYQYLKHDEWIIMPDHIHGIMIIKNNEKQMKSISELIGAFKTTSSKMIHQLGSGSFQWHKSFYDEIIRSELMLKNIRKYIIENPEKYK